MNRYENEVTSVSSRLRKRVIEILMYKKRPLALQEIKLLLKYRDKELYNEVSQKCKDYIRITISKTKYNIFSSYSTKKAIASIDPRSSFYGLTSEKYPEDIWKLERVFGKETLQIQPNCQEKKQPEQKILVKPKNKPEQTEEDKRMFPNIDDDIIFTLNKDLQNGI